MSQQTDHGHCANEPTLSPVVHRLRAPAWDQAFAALEARLRVLSTLAGAGRPPAADSTRRLQAELQGCLDDLQRLHADCCAEQGRRRRLELDLFDARVARLQAARTPARGEGGAGPPRQPAGRHLHLTPSTGDRS